MATQNLEKGQLPSYQDLAADAKEKLHITTPAALQEGRQPTTPPSAPANKMVFYRRTILFLAFTWLMLYGVAIAGENQLRWQRGCHKAQVPEQQSGSGTGASAESSSSFAALLNGASARSLHDLLHRHFPKKFQDGVWESEHHAVRAVHQADPALASSILQLAKRQENNSTTASTAETSTSTTTSSSTPANTPSTRSTPTGTPSPTSTNTQTTITRTSTSSSAPAPPTGTLSEPTLSRSSSVSSGSSGTPSGSSSGVSSFTAPSRLVSSVIDGETTLTTSTITDSDEPSTTPSPTRSSRPIVTTFTRTSNGNVVVITSTTFVDAEPTDAGSGTTTRPTPGLQNSAPQQQRGSLLAGVIAVVAMLMA